MLARNLRHHLPQAQVALLAGALCASSLATPLSSLAQDGSGDIGYAATELNLRKGPGDTDAIFAVVPAGAEL